MIILYYYKWRSFSSVKPTQIYDENNNIIGTIKKTYSNQFIRIIDLILFKGTYFLEYMIYDSKENLQLKAKKDIDFRKRTQFFLNYYAETEEYQIHLIDKKTFDFGEITTFEFAGEMYELNQRPFEWAKITNLNTNLIIAEWKEPIKPPFNIIFKLLEESYKDKVLLLIGIFHSYLHAAGH
ncbi:hypothetical protein [Bacillus sp. DX3.1]|uniref:tubby C-terminal domain-like protein n=1 Tax=Bacillus sp. DX3.1 TaxID=3052091 RepID=UPI0025712632|nr:hypothetical protein [Bacillus sp. DX3.1]WJE84532.1 hypothetical protein QRE67_28360 [Bacillus sp. DX3.1]